MKTKNEMIPLYDRILVEECPLEEMSAGGILLPGTADEKTHKGNVIAVGHGRILPDGSLKKLTVKVGDCILYGKYSGAGAQFKGHEYVVVREDEVIAIIK